MRSRFTSLPEAGPLEGGGARAGGGPGSREEGAAAAGSARGSPEPQPPPGRALDYGRWGASRARGPRFRVRRVTAAARRAGREPASCPASDRPAPLRALHARRRLSALSPGSASARSDSRRARGPWRLSGERGAVTSGQGCRTRSVSAAARCAPAPGVGVPCLPAWPPRPSAGCGRSGEVREARGRVREPPAGW